MQELFILRGRLSAFPIPSLRRFGVLTCKGSDCTSACNGFVYYRDTLMNCGSLEGDWGSALGVDSIMGFNSLWLTADPFKISDCYVFNRIRMGLISQD